MFITVEATYESGVLKLRQPLPLDEHETVRVILETDKPGSTVSLSSMSRHDSDVTEPPAMNPVCAPSLPTDGPSDDFVDSEILDIWLDVPPSPAAMAVTATRGQPILPRRFEFDDSDLAPE